MPVLMLIKVKPRRWLDKKDWREIHDILGVQGFNWLGNGIVAG
jgi:hypothetical protein